MPKVPEYTPSVNTRALPDGTLDISTNPQQFGAGIGAGLSDIGQNMVKMQAEDDAIAATDAFNTASEDAQKYLYNGNDAIYSKEGKNAIGSYDTSKKYFDEVSLKYSESLKNENQRKAFHALWSKRSVSNLDGVARHEAAQRKKYADDTQQANLQANINDASNNYDKPEAVAASLLNADTIIRANAAGHSEAVVQLKQAEARSEIHKAVVDNMMINDPSGAREYYEANKDSIDGKYHVAIRSALKGNQQKKDAQAAADKILQSTKTDDEKRAAAKKITDPDVRALTEAMVSQDISQRKTDRIEQERQMTEAFWNEFIKNPDINTIPENIPADVKLRALTFATASTRKTDLKTWNEINQISINDPEKFAKMDLFKYVNNLDESDFQAFGKLQRTIGKDKLALTHVQSINSKMTKALKDIGVKLETDKGQVFARKFQDAVSTFEVNNSRKIQPTEVDHIIDTLLLEGNIKGSGFFGTDIGSGGRLYEADTSAAFVIKDVPPDERAKIIDAYKRKGITPTEEQISELYTKKKIK